MKQCPLCLTNDNMIRSRVLVRGSNGIMIYEEEYEERCSYCNNLLYGYIKPVSYSKSKRSEY